MCGARVAVPASCNEQCNACCGGIGGRMGKWSPLIALPVDYGRVLVSWVSYFFGLDLKAAGLGSFYYSVCLGR